MTFQTCEDNKLSSPRRELQKLLSQISRPDNYSAVNMTVKLDVGRIVRLQADRRMMQRFVFHPPRFSRGPSLTAAAAALRCALTWRLRHHTAHGQRLGIGLPALFVLLLPVIVNLFSSRFDERPHFSSVRLTIRVTPIA